MKILYIILAIAAAIDLVACEDETILTSYQRYHDVIPLQTGNTWVYQNWNGELQVYAVGERYTNSFVTPWYNWIVTSPGRMDYYYAALHRDTFLIAAHPESSAAMFAMFVMPLKVGQRWMHGSDSVWVEAIDSITVPSGTFTHAFRVVRRDREGCFIITETNWIELGVGIVQQELTYSSLHCDGPIGHHYELVRYELK